MKKKTELLISHFLNSTAEPEEIKELDRIIRTDPDVRKEYLLNAALDARAKKIFDIKAREKEHILAESPGKELFAGETAYGMFEDNTLSRRSWDRAYIRRTGWWGMSLILHAACILIAAFFLVFPPERKNYETTVRLDQGKIKNYGYIKKKHNINNTYTGLGSPGPLEEKAGFEFSQEMPPDDFLTPEELDMAHTAERMNPEVSEMDMNSEHWVSPIQDYGEGFALFNIRTGNNRKEALMRYGGSHATEAAVLAALNWFKRHQAEDGSWSFEDYHNECRLNPPCRHVPETLTSGRVASRKKTRRLENAATGLGLLCYLGAGHTHKTGKFRKQAADSISFLLNAQETDGSFSEGNYTHAIAAMAIIESYGMTKSPLLRGSAQKAVDIILARQNRYMGWDYEKKSNRSDTSITGWAAMALKSAKYAGFDVDERLKGVQRFLAKVTPEVKGAGNPKLAHHVSYQFIQGKNSTDHRNATLTAIGMLCRIFIGENTKGKMLRAHANMILEAVPENFNDADLFRVYYATLAMFQMGGHYWKEWNAPMKKVLCENQCRGGCEDGSWYIEKPVWYNQVGRLFHTAMGCLTLEVYYRYIPFFLHNELGDTK